MYKYKVHVYWQFTPQYFSGREDVEEGQGCVMRSTVINVSKEMMSYSDFPVPDSFPVFMHNKQVTSATYIRSYAGCPSYTQCSSYYIHGPFTPSLIFTCHVQGVQIPFTLFTQIYMSYTGCPDTMCPFLF